MSAIETGMDACIQSLPLTRRKYTLTKKQSGSLHLIRGSERAKRAQDTSILD